MNNYTKNLVNHQFQDGGEEYEATAFDGFGDYFRRKATKLQNQAQEAKTHEHNDAPQIFTGCAIYINGYTRPSAAELKRLIILHGGIVVSYLSGKSYASHIVASNLTARKRIEFRQYKVVTPDWIVACVEQGKRLAWHSFRLIRADDGQGVLKESEETQDEVHDIEEVASVENGQRQELNAAQEISESNTEDLESVENVQRHVLDAAQETFETDSHPDPETPDPPTLEEDLEVAVADVTDVPSDRLPLSCLDPLFITRFYESSRLHFLSTHKARLKQRFQRSGPKLTPRLVMHIDFDSFFVAVSLLRRPDLRDQPVCVSNSAQGNGDVASCNYAARAFGVRNGTWVAEARKKCPTLQVLPYDFAGYEKASEALYKVLENMGADCVFPVSIDEALVDVSSLVQEPLQENAINLALSVRRQVRELTGVEVSVGLGPNVLLAKLALRKAKPSSQCYYGGLSSDVDALSVRDLPGVGHSTAERLASNLHVSTVGQMRSISLNDLQALLGTKVGVRMYEYARGIDHTDISIVPGPKSVGLEISWGVRLKTDEEAAIFLGNMAVELSRKLAQVDAGTSTQLVLKLYRRHPQAPVDPPKFLGHGHCDIYSKSSVLYQPTNDAGFLGRMARNLLRTFACPAVDIRGIGLQAVKLKTKTPESALKRSLSSPKRPRENSASPMSESPRASTFGARSPKHPRLDPPSPSKSAATAAGRTLTQQFKPKVKTAFRTPSGYDAEVFGQLPTRIQRQLVREYAERKEQERMAEQVRAHKDMMQDMVLKPYEPVVFEAIGQASEQAVCDSVSEWIQSGIRLGHLPHYDDVVAVEKYLCAVCEHDRDWGKAVRLCRWMDRISQNSEWHELSQAFGVMIKDELNKRGINI